MTSRDREVLRSFVGALATVGIGAVLVRALSSITHVVLGSLLTAEDFATYAFASSIAAWLWPMRNAGHHRLMLVSSALAPVASRLRWLNGALAIVVVVSITAIMPAVFPQVTLVAVLFGLATLTMGTADLAEAGAFRVRQERDVAQARVFASLGRSSVVVAGALTGLGAAALAAGQVVQGALTSGALRWRHRNRWGNSSVPREEGPPPAEGVSRGAMPGLESGKEGPSSPAPSRTRVAIVVGVVASSASLSTDYLLLGWLTSAEQLGQYYFGYQFTVALASLLGPSLFMALAPRFRQGDLELGRRSPLQVMFLGGLVPIAALAALLLPLAVLAIWGDKWRAAAGLMPILLYSLPVRLLIPTLDAHLAASHRWGAVAAMSVLDVVAIASGVTVGFAFGGLLGAAVGVTAAKVFGAAVRSGAVPESRFLVTAVAVFVGGFVLVAMTLGEVDPVMLQITLLMAALVVAAMSWRALGTGDAAHGP